MVPGTLFVVATPIGNLEDITLRALRVLREADLIAAEDTRRTAKLLTHHGIRTPTISFHAHNARTRVPQLLERLLAGAKIALVTDAGTPGISDPGPELIGTCRAEGIPVDPIPGASAPLVAAAGSGFPLTPLTIFGFAPHRALARKRWLETVAEVQHTCVLFEAPTRIAGLMDDIAQVMGERQIVVGRELTKVHQEFLSGTAGTLRPRLTSPKGEFTVVLGPWQPAPVLSDDVSDGDIASEFWRTTDSGHRSRREHIAAVARKYGRTPRQVYEAVERAKNSGQ